MWYAVKGLKKNFRDMAASLACARERVSRLRCFLNWVCFQRILPYFHGHVWGVFQGRGQSSSARRRPSPCASRPQPRRCNGALRGRRRGLTVRAPPHSGSKRLKPSENKFTQSGFTSFSIQVLHYQIQALLLSRGFFGPGKNRVIGGAF